MSLLSSSHCWPNKFEIPAMRINCMYSEGEEDRYIIEGGSGDDDHGAIVLGSGAFGDGIRPLGCGDWGGCGGDGFGECRGQVQCDLVASLWRHVSPRFDVLALARLGAATTNFQAKRLVSKFGKCPKGPRGGATPFPCALNTL